MARTMRSSSADRYRGRLAAGRALLRRFNPVAYRRSLRRLGHRLVVVLVGAGLFLLSPGTSAVVYGQSEPSRLAAALNQVDEMMGLLEQLQAEVALSEFDLDALALELAFEDMATIAEWVRANIRYEPYEGVLRGARGTLVSGAGNALDQAVLTARLLADAGYEARVATAAIPPDLARRLLDQAATPPEPRGPAIEPERAHPILSRLADLFAASGVDLSPFAAFVTEAPANSEDDGFTAAMLDADMLISELEDAAITVGSNDVSAQLEARATRYAWVQARTAESEPWQAFHPAFASTPSGMSSLLEEDVFQGAVPDAYLHKLRFQAFIDRRVGDEFETVPIMDPYERPAANLDHVAISFANLPDSFLGPDAAAVDPRELYGASNMFFPLLNGRQPSGAMAFDRTGAVLPPDAAASYASGLFQTVGDDFNRAAGSLGALGRSAPDESSERARTLTRVWIEYAWIAPDGTERVQSRTLFPRERPGGPSNEADPDDRALVAADSSTEINFFVATGAFDRAYLVYRELEAVLASRGLIEDSLRSLAGAARDAPDARPETMASLGALPFLYLLDRIDSGSRRVGTVFRSSPTLIAIESGHALTGQEAAPSRFVSVDIVFHGRTALAVREGRVVHDAEAVLRTGVWETHAERMPALDRTGANVARFNTIDALVRAQSEGSTLRVVRDGDDAALASLGLPESAAKRLQTDLDQGMTIVAPSPYPREGAALAAWWRVDTRTGDTLGVTSDGRGQGYIDALLLLGLGTIIAGTACMIFLILVYAPGYVVLPSGEIIQGEQPGESQFRTCLSVGVGFGALVSGVLVPGAILVPIGAFIFITMNDIDSSFF